jgi:uncharacterized protein
MAVQISLYLNEADEYRGRPLHLEVLNYLRAENIAGATVFHALAGFTGGSRVKTTSLVEAGGKLPLVLTFIDDDEHVTRVLPRLREMAGQRLIVRFDVTIEQGPID